MKNGFPSGYFTSPATTCDVSTATCQSGKQIKPTRKPSNPLTRSTHRARCTRDYGSISSLSLLRRAMFSRNESRRCFGGGLLAIVSRQQFAFGLTLASEQRSTPDNFVTIEQVQALLFTAQSRHVKSLRFGDCVYDLRGQQRFWAR